MPFSNIWRTLVCCAALAFTAACANPGAAADGPAINAADRGRMLAENVCSACHGVGPGQTRSPNPNAPTFDTVANMPGMTQTALNAWLYSPHPSMPNYRFTQGQTDDIAAYLESLKTQ